MAQADGAAEHHYAGSVSAWSPGGSQLAFTRLPPPEDVEATSWVVRPGAWEPRQIGLPGVAMVRAWIPAE